MSLEVANQRLRSLFTSDFAKVIYLTGDWGEGKTHQWRMALEHARTSQSKVPYAYVSLFGMNSLQDVRKRLTEEFVSGIRVPGENGTLGEKVSDLISKTKYFQAIKILPLIPYIAKAEGLISELSFSSVKNAVICFDDLERKGSGLSISDIYGLASFLKEERKCRILLIGNDLRLNDNDAKAAHTFAEKVIDENVAFAATAREAVGIGMDGKTGETSELLRDQLISLNITNIRVIGRLSRLTQAMSTVVRDLDPQVAAIGVRAITLFGIGHFLPDREFPTIAYMISRHRQGWFGQAFNQKNKAHENLTEEEKQYAVWEEFLSKTEAPSDDPFEIALGDAIRKGYLPTDLRTLAESLAVRLGERALHDKFIKSWRDFWHSLSGSGNDLINSLVSITKEALPVIGTGDLSQAYDALFKLDRKIEANEIVASYIAIHKNNPAYFDEARAPFREYFNGSFGEHMRAAFEKYRERPAVAQALENISPSGYNIEDVKIVAAAEIDELADLVKAASGQTFRQYIQAILRLPYILPEDTAAIATASAFKEKLRDWAACDPVTALRLKQYLQENS